MFCALDLLVSGPKFSALDGSLCFPPVLSLLYLCQRLIHTVIHVYSLAVPITRG